LASKRVTQTGMIQHLLDF